MKKDTPRMLTLETITIGESASIERRISERDVTAFAEVSGDYNPLHVDEAYAKTTSFGGRVVHGMFLGALISQLIGMQLPGRYALLVKETLEFKKPVHIGEIVTVIGTVTSKSSSTGLIEVDIAIHCAGTTVATGAVHVRVLQ